MCRHTHITHTHHTHMHTAQSHTHAHIHTCRHTQQSHTHTHTHTSIEARAGYEWSCSSSCRPRHAYTHAKKRRGAVDRLKWEGKGFCLACDFAANSACDSAGRKGYKKEEKRFATATFPPHKKAFLEVAKRPRISFSEKAANYNGYLRYQWLFTVPMALHRTNVSSFF